MQTGALYVTTDADKLAECEHMLLYLTALTWTSGEQSTQLAKEVAQAMDLGVHILLAHEMVGSGDQMARHGCEFATFFSCEDGATPEKLLHKGIYSEIAVALKGGRWREASMALLGASLHSRKTVGDTETAKAQVRRPSYIDYLRDKSMLAFGGSQSALKRKSRVKLGKQLARTFAKDINAAGYETKQPAERALESFEADVLAINRKRWHTAGLATSFTTIPRCVVSREVTSCQASSLRHTSLGPPKQADANDGSPDGRGEVQLDTRQDTRRQKTEYSSCQPPTQPLTSVGLGHVALTVDPKPKRTPLPRGAPPRMPPRDAEVERSPRAPAAVRWIERAERQEDGTTDEESIDSPRGMLGV